MYRKENVLHPHKSSNFNKDVPPLKQKGFANINNQHFNRHISGFSQLPLRSKSGALSNKNVTIKNRLDYKRPAATSLSTWSDISPCSDILKSHSSTVSKLKTLHKIGTKTESELKSQSAIKLIGCCKTKSSRNGQKAKIPINSNNSSCEKLTCFSKKPKFMKSSFGDYEKLKDINIETRSDPASHSELQHSNQYIEKYNSCRRSIFRLFRMKIDMYREKLKNSITKGTGSLDCIGNVSNKTDEEYKSLDNPLSRIFLLKLYNECRKLNGNIMKLTKNNPELGGQLNNQSSSEKFQNFLSDLNKKSNVKSDSINSFSSKSLSNENCFDKITIHKHQRSRSNCISTEKNHETPDENNGHYYHLACVLSSGPERIHSSNISIESINKEEESLLSKSEGKESNFKSIDKTFHIISNKSKSSANSIDNLLNIPNLKNEENNCHQIDDTFFNLDDNMSTDSLEDVKIITKDIKAAVSSSNYLTVNENCKELKQKPNNVTTKSKLESLSSYEMPSLPSLKYPDDFIDSQSSFMNIIPPDLDVSFAFSKQTKSENVSHLPASQFVAIFEKQFPQDLVLINTKAENSNLSTDKPEITKFTSSITINCYKENARNTNRISIESHGSQCFFNPFKPPKCNGTKLLPFLNSNNNNLSDSERKLDSTRSVTDEIKLTKSLPPQDENISKKDRNDLMDNSESVIKRIAPRKELLMHARNSDKMNYVFTDHSQESKTDPSNNSYIEKQREKKIIKQREQHQKAKDMAIEAARLRKERQAEIQSLDSFDSSRIIERLFTENDHEYPEFSLYDACHYNFMKKRTRKPKPLAQSTITGILPEEPEKMPEPPKSPVTNEKFRKEPISFVKRVQVKKEFTKKELEKYEPVSNFKPPSPAEIILKQPDPIEIVDTNNKKKINNIPLTKLSSSSTSSSDENSVSSISSYLSDSKSPSISETSCSTESSSAQSIKTKNNHKRNSKNHTNSAKRKHRYVDKKEKRISHSKHNIRNITYNKIENHNALQNMKLKKGVEKVKTISTGNKEFKSPTEKESFKFETIKSEDVSVKSMECTKHKRNYQITNDASVSTENDQLNCTNKYSSSTQIEENPLFDENDLKDSNSNIHVCHLNHQRNYNENIMDRTLSLHMKVPISDTSLSAFVQELNSQLHSLADTVDILMNRMESFEANLLDASKYFIYK